MGMIVDQNKKEDDLIEVLEDLKCLTRSINSKFAPISKDNIPRAQKKEDLTGDGEKILQCQSQGRRVTRKAS